MDRISHSTAVDIGGGRMGFRSKDTVAGIPGTVLPAGWLNPFQEEIMAVQEAAGLAPDSANWAQVLEATRGQAANYRAVGGTANALTFSSVAAHKIPAYVAGQPFRFITGAAPNTGACTFKADDLAAVPLVKRNGAALVAGDLPAATAFEAIYIAGSVRLLDMVASDIAAGKTAFNVTQTVFTARASLSATGMLTYQTGTYTKKSGTSQLIVEVSTNAFSLSGTAMAFGRISGLPTNMEWIVRNGDTGTSSPASTGSKIYTGVAAGAVNWTWSFGRNDAGAWSSIVNPRSPTDAAFLPVETTSFITFSELEP